MSIIVDVRSAHYKRTSTDSFADKAELAPPDEFEHSISDEEEDGWLEAIILFSAAYEQEFGHEPDVQIISEYTGLRSDKVRSLLLGELNLVDANEYIESEAFPSVEEIVMKNMSNEKISAVLNRLSDRKHRMIALRYGLEGNAPHSMVEIANLEGISEQRVSQLINYAIKSMRILHKEFDRPDQITG